MSQSDALKRAAARLDFRASVGLEEGLRRSLEHYGAAALPS